MHGAGLSIGPALTLAAGATAIGFLSFVPTRYTGIRELGWIAGVGMVIAITLNFLLLPAMLRLLRPRGEPEPIGFRRAAGFDHFLLRRRGWIIGAALLLALGSLALLPRLSFDFDPIDLKNPNSESVATARDLMQDPMTSPYTAEVLAPSLAEAEPLADRLAALPEVAQAVTAASFIPVDQEKKLAIIQDLALLLGPTLTPTDILPQPSDPEVLKAIADCRNALQPVAAAAGPQSPAAQLAQALDAVLGRGAAILPALRETLLPGLEQRLAKLAVLLQATPVILAGQPPELRQSWIAPDGQARVEVFPRGDARDHDNLERFVAAVRSVAPDATGTPVTIQEAGRLISSAFLQAGIIAVTAPPARGRARHRAAAARRNHDPGGDRPFWHAAQLRQYHRPAPAARHRGRVRHLFRHELARRAGPSSAIEHGPGGGIQRPDDDVCLRQPGAVERPRHLRYGPAAGDLARLHAVLHPDRPAGVARPSAGEQRNGPVHRSQSRGTRCRRETRAGQRAAARSP